MIHVFVLYIFLGVGEDKKLISKDMYFKNLKECTWYAKTFEEQKNKIASYCLPTRVNKEMKPIY